ncbi:hypothetical protein MKEN_00440700 [Mycena kentingensis (nom. inval.)]|nr:hypothetical protein MKEN_00440700 [Mycena kentingensis (nom. inval.)]
MGVRALNALLRQKCPNAVKVLPHSLGFKALSGKRIVIDGSFVTHHLYKSSVQHQYPHILGWYTLIKALRDANVSVKCVFDGKAIPEKERELQRRRDARDLAASQAKLESERVQRLARVAELVKLINPSHAQKVIAQASASKVVWADRWNVAEEDVHCSVDWDASTLVSQRMPASQSEFVPSELEADEACLVCGHYDMPAEPNFFRYAYADSIDPTPSSSYLLPPSYAPIAELEALYAEFCRSEGPFPSRSDWPSSPGSQTVKESRSSRQRTLTADETDFWEDLGSGSNTGVNLDVLAERADGLFQAYLSKSKTLGWPNLKRAVRLLRAMGVPCLFSDETYEAEAMAASIVRAGLADYVASEDTDVLLFDAPLLQNLINSSQPLQILSPVDIRTALDLSPSAFLDLALLLGSDFTQPIKSLAPDRAFRFIQQYSTIEALLEQPAFREHRDQLEKDVGVEAYMADIRTARTLFTTLPEAAEMHQDGKETLMINDLHDSGMGAFVEKCHRKPKRKETEESEMPAIAGRRDGVAESELSTNAWRASWTSLSRNMYM